ncbi:hypothetical protein Tco_1225257, partial [Tanacetum coccineum]
DWYDPVTGVMVTASRVNRDAVSTICENENFVFDEKFPALDSINKDDFVYEGFSKNHFSKVAIDNATGIFQYHEVAFVGMSIEDMTDHAGNFDVVQAAGSYPSLYPRRSRIL